MAAEKKKIDNLLGLNEAFVEIVEPCTAGIPQDETIKWTYLTQEQMVSKLRKKGFSVSRKIICQLLQKHGYKKRKMLKSKSMGQAQGRDEQFQRIAIFKQVFEDKGLPILSIDTKKKELLGNFHRNGSIYAKQAPKVNDHDFKSAADGQLVPHGIYDVSRNKGYLTLGQSHDTSEFVCDNLRHFWCHYLQWDYPDADSLLLLCDGGGSNNCRHYIVKQDLSRLARQLAINILVAHYPPYCSKWNPIEHRLFSQVSRSWNGVVFKDIQTVKEQAEKTKTKTGLSVIVRVNTKNYQTQRSVNKKFKNNIQDYLDFDDQKPIWNYIVKA